MRKCHNEAFVESLRPEFDAFMKRAETIRWSPATIDSKKIDYSKLAISDLFGVFVTLHIENYSDVYTKLLIEAYADVPMIKEFILNWEREEENHARVLESYLIEVGIPLDELRANYAKVNKDDFPQPSRNQTGLNVFVFLQELFTREMYTKMLKCTKEPVLTDILKRVVRDEERHYRFYKQALELRLDLDKKDTLRQFRKIVRIFGMPQTMYRQQSMTDKLMEYFPFNPMEMRNIALPVMRALEASSPRWLAKFPRLDGLWRNRRSVVYVPQSRYLWGHVSIAVRRKLGLLKVPKADRDYVDSIVARLQGLLDERRAERDNLARARVPSLNLAQAASV